MTNEAYVALSRKCSAATFTDLRELRRLLQGGALPQEIYFAKLQLKLRERAKRMPTDFADLLDDIAVEFGRQPKPAPPTPAPPTQPKPTPPVVAFHPCCLAIPDSRER